MTSDPELAALMRQAIVEPLVQWLRLALEMPEGDLEDVPAPWAGFLRDLQGTLEEWAAEVAKPWSIDRLTGIEGVRELAVILRFVMRRAESRGAYIDYLEAREVIPLNIANEDFEGARRILVKSGRTEHEINRLIGPAWLAQPNARLSGPA